MLILKNAKIYTQDSANPFADAIAINSGRIVAIGKEVEILNLRSPGDKVEDLNGETLLPGFTDAHLHLQYLGNSIRIINCETPTLLECLAKIRTRVNQVPPGDWILGHGWNHNIWSAGYGSKKDLDAISVNHPIYLTHKSLHVGWANSMALDKAGIHNELPDPQGGSYGRNPDGSLNGLLFEKAMEVMESKLPKMTPDQLAKNINSTQKFLWQFGITGVHDFDGSDSFSALQILDLSDLLRIRVVKSIPLSSFESAIQSGLRTGYGSDYLQVGSLKLFSDGALGPKTAAMILPYENEASNFGSLLLNEEDIFNYGVKAATNGISLAIHAIGDNANKQVINGIRRLRRFESENKIYPLNHRIEHVQVLSPDDFGEFSKLAIFGSVQPIHVMSDMFTADRNWGKRSKFAYAFQSLLDQGTELAFGSDSPVESPNPFWGIHAAINRQQLNGQPGEYGWNPEQRISLQNAIQSYTQIPARISHWNTVSGSLQPGYFADMVRLPVDIYQIPGDEIKDLIPTATMVGGEWVWRAE